MNPQNLVNAQPSDFQADLDPLHTTNEPYAVFDLELDDKDLIKRCVDELTDNVNHWEKAPWLLTQTDTENINYILGSQLDEKMLLPHQARYVDNRLFTSVRAILAYATGQTAKPAIMPSKTDDRYKRIAKQMEQILYQHAINHDVNDQMRTAAKNLIMRKRGLVKLKFDEDDGPYGDICSESIDPSDVVVDRYAKYGEEPKTLYFRQKCSIQELVAKFPDKQKEIYAHFSIIRGTYAQLAKIVTYYECWFSYFDKDNKEREGLCWFLPNSEVILGKMRNPNWVYTGDDTKDRVVNMTACPPKPFVWLNYWNTGRSYIDETCLFDQAMPQQDILNRRGRQIVENADYANPRTLVDKRVMDESDAKKFVNKNPKTIGLIDTSETGNNINNSVMTISASQLPSYVMEDKFDARNEIDTIMGTPTQFRGEQANSKNPTLGQDLLIKNQASALQDDIVRAIDNAWRQYYILLMQMMMVYLPDDYWLTVEGEDGEYAKVTLHSDNMDTNVRLSVQTDSTLPLDKQSQRATAIQLAQIPGRIDDLSLFEMLGLPEPDKMAERVSRFNLDRYTYMASIETQMYNYEAEADISLITAGRQAEERDDYNESYLNYWNEFITTNRFARLPVDVKQRLVATLQGIAEKAAQTEGLRTAMLNPAGILDRPPAMPLPKVTEQIRLQGQIAPDQAAQTAAAGTQTPAPSSAPPAAGSNSPSPTKMTNPGQFGP